MGKKTLAEELADLVNPAPVQEFDPEADIFGEGPVVEEYQEDDFATRRGRKIAGEGTRLRGDIVLDDKLYGGKATSRATIFGQEKGGSDNDSDEDVDGLMIEGSSGRQEDEEDIDEVERKDDDGGDYEQAEEDSQKSEDEVPGDLEQEYNQLQQEEAETMKVLQQHRDAQRKKGLAVYAQQRIWDGALEIRILLQRVLQGANRFPRSKARNTIKKLDPQLYSGLQGVANMAAGALEDVLGLLSAIERQNPALLESGSMIESSKQPSKNKMTGRKRTIEELWGRLDDAYNRFIPFRDAAVDRWHRKTMLASGTAARGGLKVLNQTISSQVKMLMQDVDRVVERSRMPKRSITALCSVESEIKNGELEPSLRAEGATVEEQRDPETYDDTEFYQNLLREFLDGKQGSIGSVYSGPKKRKMVDRRASKGRKIRYNIHDKLVNFMTPVDLKAPQFASSIFANLFGGYVK